MKKPAAIITGASSGLGKALSVKLSDKYFVYLISRNVERLKKTEDEILKKNNKCRIIVADISEKDSIEYISSKIKDKRNIDLLVNNAGVAIFDNISNLSINDWVKQINVNLTASFLMTKMVVDSLKAKEKGSIVFVNSVAGLNPYKNSSAYVASKYGLKGFACSLREELREHNIKVMSFYPGAINTSLWDGMDMDVFREEMMSVEDVSNIIVDSINSPNNCVSEDVTIRRIKGDF